MNLYEHKTPIYFLQEYIKGQRYILHTLEYCHEETEWRMKIRMEDEKKGNEMNQPVNEQVRPKTLKGQ